MSPVLSVKNLSLIRQRPLLQNINWIIEAGQHWCILGANGSGKTLLLKTLLAYEARTTGEIQVLEKNYGHHDWRELRKQIGWISNDLARKIAPSTTGLQVVLSGLNAGIGYCPENEIQEDNKVKDIFNQIGCDYLRKQPWKYCSQGERQRLLIGRALLSNFRILILDEPCSSLDPVSRIKFLQFLRELINNNKLPALILVTHHIEEIIPEITHVLILNEGSVLSQGEKRTQLTNALLSEAFDTDLCIQKNNDDYRITITNKQ